MPISDELRANSKIDYKQKYVNLKRKLKILIYESESYSEELKKAERQLLQVSRDKAYLLDRLLQYEKIESSTTDSENTLSSDSEVESRKLETKKKKTTENPTNDSQTIANTSRKKKTNTQTTATTRSRSSSTGKPSKSLSMATQVNGCSTSSAPNTTTSTAPTMKSELSSTLTSSVAVCSQPSKPLLSTASSVNIVSSVNTPLVTTTSSVNTTIDGHMTSEELERHLESRRQPSALLMPEKTPLTVPVELFSNESSNGLPDDDNNHLNLKLMQ